MTMSAMNRAKIITELENMVVARLFSGRPWLADRETISAVDRKLIQMGLVELVRVEPKTWRLSPLGKELDVDLFLVFMGIFDECEVPGILEDYHLLDEFRGRRHLRPHVPVPDQCGICFDWVCETSVL